MARRNVGKGEKRENMGRQGRAHPIDSIDMNLELDLDAMRTPEGNIHRLCSFRNENHTTHTVNIGVILLGRSAWFVCLFPPLLVCR